MTAQRSKPERESKSPWGVAPWQIDYTVPSQVVPASVDFAIIGGGFTGLAAAAWLGHLAPGKSVAVFEASGIGSGASGRTGGMALAETAAGDLPGLGDVLGGFQQILGKLRIDCDFALPGAWEIGRSKGIDDSPIDWKDSGRLRVVKEVPGGTLDPGKLLAGLARATVERNAVILENQPVTGIEWKERPVVEVGGAHYSAGTILLATNALSLDLTNLAGQAEPKLALAIATEPLSAEQLGAIGLAGGNPFYTADLPYLWGRARRDSSVIFGAGLVDAPRSRDLRKIDIGKGKAPELFATIECRIRGLHPALEKTKFTHRWGGPILFTENWQPVFMRHPRGENAIVLGAYAGHGVALSTYLGAWAAEVLLGRRKLPRWGALQD
jgi:glycine/D-amino acid oxidase-like deaminating enzyme